MTDSASQPLSGDADLLRHVAEKVLRAWKGDASTPIWLELMDELEATLSTLQVSSDRSEPINAPIPNRPEPIYPIPLNDAQQCAVKEWAADDRLWTTQETVEMNLRTFARVIFSHVSSGSAQEWQPIETAPKDESTVLLLIPPSPASHDGKVSTGLWGGKRWLSDWGAHMVGEPSHWMPLPASPASSARSPQLEKEEEKNADLLGNTGRAD